MLQNKRIQTLEDGNKDNRTSILDLWDAIDKLWKQVDILRAAKGPDTDRRRQAHGPKWRRNQSKKMKAYWATKKAKETI